jgi:hypothetical protein
MGVRPVLDVRRPGDWRIRGDECVFSLPLHVVFSADGHCPRELALRSGSPACRDLLRRLRDYTWRTRRTPLSVEFGGRISYGNWELCAAGTVRAVRLAESRGGEAGDCEVGLEVEGKTVFIPSWYFARFKSREHARPFAAKLAEVLEVQVTESR